MKCFKWKFSISLLYIRGFKNEWKKLYSLEYKVFIVYLLIESNVPISQLTNLNPKLVELEVREQFACLVYLYTQKHLSLYNSFRLDLVSAAVNNISGLEYKVNLMSTARVFLKSLDCLLGKRSYYSKCKRSIRGWLHNSYNDDRWRSSLCHFLPLLSA